MLHGVATAVEEHPFGMLGALVIILTLQVFAWWRLYDVSGPLLRPAVAWINADPIKQKNIGLYMIPELKSFGVKNFDSPERLVDNFATGYLAVVVHHGLAALFAFLGWYWASPWLFRLGLSFEIGEVACVQQHVAKDLTG